MWVGQRGERRGKRTGGGGRVLMAVRGQQADFEAELAPRRARLQPGDFGGRSDTSLSTQPTAIYRD